jgi:hypothetical protein
MSSTPRSRIDDALHSLDEMPAPPPSPALMDLVRASPPVPRRRPLKAFALIVVASLVVVAAHVHALDVRHDRGALPAWWFWTMTGAWLIAFGAPLAIALLPRRRSMFADTRLAQIAAFAIPALALAMALFLRIDAPPATIIPATTAKALTSIERCLLTGIEMAAVPFALGVLVLRRSPLPLRARWIGAALGAANGALAGLMLHMHCWIGGALHCGVAHAGQAVLGAIVGALLVPLLVHERDGR